RPSTGLDHEFPHRSDRRPWSSVAVWGPPEPRGEPGSGVWSTPDPEVRRSEPFGLVAPAIRAADEAVGLHDVGDLQGPGIPGQRRLGEAGREAAEQDHLGERAGVGERGGGPTVAAASLDELEVLVVALELGRLVIGEL